MPKEDLPLAAFDPLPLYDGALGGALVAMRHAVPEMPDEFDERMDMKLHGIRMEGAQWAMKQARANVAALSKDVIAAFI